MALIIYYISDAAVDKEWPSKDDTKKKRSGPSRIQDRLVHKRQVDMPGPDECCVNGTKGEKGTQG